MTKIYEQHDAAFRHVSAYAVLKCGAHVANVTLKHGDAVAAYVHWLGLEMTRGRAGGGGYDHDSAAMSAAVAKMPLGLDAETGRRVDPNGDYLDFCIHARRDDGRRWTRRLEAVGFTVLTVIA